jgi:hypothetical protein
MEASEEQFFKAVYREAREAADRAERDRDMPLNDLSTALKGAGRPYFRRISHRRSL